MQSWDPCMLHNWWGMVSKLIYSFFLSPSTSVCLCQGMNQSMSSILPLFAIWIDIYITITTTTPTSTVSLKNTQQHQNMQMYEGIYLPPSLHQSPNLNTASIAPLSVVRGLSRDKGRRLRPTSHPCTLRVSFRQRGNKKKTFEENRWSIFPWLIKYVFGKV